MPEFELNRIRRRKNRMDIVETGWMLGQMWLICGLMLAICGVGLVGYDLYTTGRAFASPRTGPFVLALGLTGFGVGIARGLDRRVICINTTTKSVSVHHYRGWSHLGREVASSEDVDIIECALSLNRFRYVGTLEFRAIVLLLDEQSVVLAAKANSAALSAVRKALVAEGGLVVRVTPIHVAAPGFRFV